MGNRLRGQWQSGGAAFGAFCTIPNGLSAESLARAGFDFIVLDAQHGGPTMDTLLSLVQAVELGGAVPLVRVPWNDPSTIMRALDVGAEGVIVPMVSTAAEARAAVAACRYAPQGVRSFGRVRGAPFRSLDQANGEALCIVMIETAEGLENAEEIVRTTGVDGVFIGAVDLAISLGLGLDTTNHVLVDAVERILTACRRHDVIASTFALGADKAIAAIEQGYQLVALGADGHYLRQGADRDVTALRTYNDTIEGKVE